MQEHEDEFAGMMRALDELRTRPVPPLARLRTWLAWLMVRLLATR